MANRYRGWGREGLVALSVAFGLWFSNSGIAQEAPPELQIVYADDASGPSGQTTVYVPQTADVITIDGALEEQAWESAYHRADFDEQWSPIGTEVLLTRDDKALYVAYINHEPLIQKIYARIPPDVRDGKLWYDDCVDLLFASRPGETRQFLTNANGARQDFLDKDQKWNPEWQAAGNVLKDRWHVEVRFPLETLGLAGPGNGQALSANFRRARRAPYPYSRSKELSSAFGTYNSLRGLLVFGTKDERREYLRTHPESLTCEAKCYLDRSTYVPDWEKRAHGRVRLVPGPGQLAMLPDLAVTLALVPEGQEGDAIASAPLRFVGGPVADLSFGLRGLAPGDYVLVLTVKLPDGKVLATGKRSFHVVDKTPEAKRSGRIRIEVSPRPEPVATGWPLTAGVAFPRGALWDESHVRLLDDADREVACQKRILNRWSRHGSIKWLQLHFRQPPESEGTVYRVEYGHARAARRPLATVSAVDSGSRIAIDTGKLRLTIRKKNFDLIEVAHLDADGDGVYEASEEILSPSDGRGPYMVDQDGVRYTSGHDWKGEVVIEESGPLKAVVKAEGLHRDKGGRPCGKYITRITAYAGAPFVRLSHTFVITRDTATTQYRDAGLDWGTAAKRIALRTPTGWQELAGDASGYVLQFDHQHYGSNLGGESQDLEGRLAGVATATGADGSVSLIARDFWQNYPSELEVDKGSLVYHFWPRHGRAPTHTAENLQSSSQACHLWFVHEGKLLDFRYPQDVVDKFAREYGGFKLALESNAMGLAKTHEMLLHFSAASQGREDTEKLSRLVNADPRPHVAPAWWAEAGVFGPFAPEPEGLEPRYGKSLAVSSDWMVNVREALDDYGMFNYGDVHQSWKGNGWNPHRVWAGMHHGGPRWAWMQYFRRPTPANYRFAEGYTRHCFDIDVCHYATDEYNRKHWSRYEKKAVGGLCKYNAPVHWTQGDATGSGYNNETDFLLWYYYLTGERRALDVTLEMGGPLKTFLGGGQGRGAEGPGCASLKLYQHTWDNGYLEVVENQFRSLVTLEEEGAGKGFSNYHPFLDRYWEHFGDRKAREMLLKLAEEELNRSPWPWGERTTYYNWLAYGYLFTKDPDYLAAAVGHLDWFSKSYLETDDPLHRQCLTISNHPGVSGYTGQQIHTVWRGLHLHGKPVLPRELTRTYLYSTAFYHTPDRALRTTRFLVRRENDEEVHFAWKFRYRSNDAFARIISPKGEILWREKLTPNRKGHRWTHFRKDVALAKDRPAGDYVFEIGSRDRVMTSIPVQGEKIGKLSFEILPPSGSERRQSPGGLRMHAYLGYFYFRVPQTEELKMTLWPQVQQGLHGLRMLDSRGEVVGRFWWKEGRSHEWNLKVPEAERGKIWMVEKMYGPNFAVQFTGPHGPRYASFRPERLYEPKPPPLPEPLPESFK